MIIEKNKVVSIDYVLTNENGDVLDSTENQDPLVYLHGAGNLISGLEAELEGQAVKSRIRTNIAPKDAYGEYDEKLVQTVPLSSMPNSEHIKEGAQFQIDTSQGPKIASITKVENGEFTLDLNHPLAGIALNFDVQVVDIRDATEEEIEKGHIHTEGCGCGHDH